MKNRYKVIAICGPAGSGKDTLARTLADKYQINNIVSCTTRPKRKGEIEGINYFYLTKEEFNNKFKSGEMFEVTNFNGWLYGTAKTSFKEEAWNVGVFNPAGLQSLMCSGEVESYMICLMTSNKERLLRQLNREENPDINEIIRRYQADKQDFENFRRNFPHCNYFVNNTQEDLNSILQTVAYDCALSNRTR